MITMYKDGKLITMTVQQYNEYVASLRSGIALNDDGTIKGDNVPDLDTIWVNGEAFKGIAYQGLLNVNTKTYVEEPERVNDGSMPNINDYDTFVVPRCTVNFKYFSIDDYRRMCEAVQSNEFYVKYYDKQFNEFVMHKMYCEPEEMVKLYNVGTNVIGVLDYEVSFIGTLNDLDTFTITYDANGGSIAGNPTIYNSSANYEKGDRVYISADDQRYFEAIYYVNSFENIDLSNTTYWLNHTLAEFSSATSYEKGDVAYQQLEDGRQYYIAIYDGGSFSGRPFSDTNYWQSIAVSVYDSETTYSSNRTSADDDTLGNFALNTDGTAIYEAIYYHDTFSGQDPTNTSYWRQLPLGTGISVSWGQSIVIADPEDLFDPPTDSSSNSWTTKPDGTGFTYFEYQSLNVFKNMTLYAKWQSGNSSNGG